MREQDREAFATLIQGVYDFYTKDLTEFAIGVWWQAMQQFELAAVREAFGRHTLNPDSGQFLPRPADVVKMLQGSTQDSALQALTKLQAAIASVGAWNTVTFDDPLIHVVVEEMGGWIALCAQQTKEWEFRLRKEFCDRYRAYKARSEVPQYRRSLMGVFDAHNIAQGFAPQPVHLIGDTKRAQRVLASGSDVPRLTITTAATMVALPVRQLEEARA